MFFWLNSKVCLISKFISFLKVPNHTPVKKYVQNDALYAYCIRKIKLFVSRKIVISRGIKLLRSTEFVLFCGNELPRMNDFKKFRGIKLLFDIIIDLFRIFAITSL